MLRRPPSGRRLPGGRAVAALTAVMVLDTADQSAIGATAPAVREAFGISQAQIGFLATSSTLVGALCALPFGILADRSRRITLLRWSVLVWIVAMAGVGLAPNFVLMLVCHAVLGLVTGAGGPLIASMIGDLVPPRARGRVFSALLIGELAGSVIGLSVAGEVAVLAGWRWAFGLLAASGVAVYLLLRPVDEPRRQDPPRRDGGPALGLGAALRVLLHNRTVVLLVLASALGYYFFAGVQTFSVSLLRDDYGASASAAPLLVLLIGLSLGVGVLIGGPAGDRLITRRPHWGRLPLLVAAFGGSLLFIVPALASRDLPVTMPLLVAGGILLGAANPALDATRIDIVPASLRGRAEAIRTATRDGADALAPTLFGVLASAGLGLQRTFLVMTATLAAALLLCLASLRSYPRDIEIAQGVISGPP